MKNILLKFLFIYIFFIFGVFSLQTSFLSKKRQILGSERLCGWHIEQGNETIEMIRGNLSYFNSNGIGCVNYQTDLDKYQRAARIAKELGMKFYAWKPALAGTDGDKKWIYDNHPEVFVVTKEGVQLHDHFVYGVHHYKFLCPNQPIVRDFLKKMYEKIIDIPEVDGINLDYIRYIEVNFRKYRPEGDTCYCDHCVNDFFEKTAINISNYKVPQDCEDWNKYRVNAITSLVNEIAKIVHAKGKIISADVYPGPWQSNKQVRQKWDEWDLDMVFPMIYTHTFNKQPEWIGTQTAEGVDSLKNNGKKTELFTGLEAEIMTDENFRIGVHDALKNGAEGISVFKLETINKEKFSILNEEINSFLRKK